MEEIDLKQIDDQINKMEQEAQERYNNFDNELYTQTEDNEAWDDDIPKGWKTNTNTTSSEGTSAVQDDDDETQPEGKKIVKELGGIGDHAS